jgi:hypothetical protein
VSFEVGEICMELLDMKVARIEEKMEKEPGYHPKKAEAEKCNEYCAQVSFDIHSIIHLTTPFGQRLAC